MASIVSIVDKRAEPDAEMVRIFRKWGEQVEAGEFCAIAIVGARSDGTAQEARVVLDQRLTLMGALDVARYQLAASAADDSTDA